MCLRLDVEQDLCCKTADAPRGSLLRALVGHTDHTFGRRYDGVLRRVDGAVWSLVPPSGYNSVDSSVELLEKAFGDFFLLEKHEGSECVCAFYSGHRGKFSRNSDIRKVEPLIFAHVRKCGCMELSALYFPMKRVSVFEWVVWAVLSVSILWYRVWVIENAKVVHWGSCLLLVAWISVSLMIAFFFFKKNRSAHSHQNSTYFLAISDDARRVRERLLREGWRDGVEAV